MEDKVRIGKKVVKDCKCPKILVVDDNGYNIHALKLMFKNEGYVIDHTSNGEDAIQMV